MRSKHRPLSGFPTPGLLGLISVLVLSLSVLSSPLLAQDFTEDFDRDACTFSSVGNNPFFPLTPGLVLELEAEEEDEGEIIEVFVRHTVTHATEVIDGVRTRVFLEEEYEDDELVEVSTNFMAHCRETGDVWYFGEDVDDYEDGEVVGHEGEWRAGRDGALAGVLMPGNPMLGARFFQEIAPDIALDRSEITGRGLTLTVEAGTFTNVLNTEDTDALDPESINDKYFAPGIGLIKDDELELTEFTLPACSAGATTHCLGGGRFAVRVNFVDFEGNDGVGQAILGSADSGEFWFFSPGNTELLVKVLDACNLSESFWVFAGGLTNVGVTLTVTDTMTGDEKVYESPVGQDFLPVLDTKAFSACS